MIPDTDVILRRVLTTIILPRFSDPRLRLPFRLAIPRLVILELENLANRSGDKTQVKKGECFMAFHEIARLKKTGAMLAAPLGLDDLSSFRSSSGSGMADAFLREEVRKFAKRIISLPEASTRPRTIFHTRDMVSALAANAEDLDAIYMAPATPEKLQIEGLNLSQVATLVTELAVSRGMGSIRWHDGAATKIEGIWSGKTWLEYDQKQVRLCDPKTNALP